jgi:Domain of unknown function (DUF4388)
MVDFPMVLVAHRPATLDLLSAIPTRRLEGSSPAAPSIRSLQRARSPTGSAQAGVGFDDEKERSRRHRARGRGDGGLTDWSQAEQGFGLGISQESKRGLGLDESNSVRVAARAGRMILLEAGDGEGAAVPWDRDLVLSGDVRSFPLADLLSLVHAAGKSGFLLFQHEGAEKAIYLNRGEVVFAESNVGADRLGAYLLRSGLVDHEQLELAERRYHNGTRFGKVVVELGILTPRDLWNGVKGQVEEIVRSLFSYTAGWIHFWEGDIEPDNVVRLSLPTNRLIAEGLDRRNDLLRFVARLEDGRTELQLGPERRAVASENERAVLDAINDDTGFSALCHRTGLDPCTAARTLQFLQLTGHVVVDHDSDNARADYTTADDDVVREAVTLHLKLIFELSAPLVALDGAGPVSERLNRILEEGEQNGRGLLDGIRFAESGALDPTQIEFQALRLTGDRVRQVDHALGEIMAYLEFELNNHPDIEDATCFLEAVEPLRAMLIR